MTYPNKEKRCAADESRQKQILMQARIYNDAESFCEYAVKCAACGVNRKIFAFGLVDPFWFHYKICDTGLIRTALRFAVPAIMVAGCATSVLCKIMSAPSYVSVVCVTAVSSVIWPISLGAAKNLYYMVESFLRDVRRKII